MNSGYDHVRRIITGSAHFHLKSRQKAKWELEDMNDVASQDSERRCDYFEDVVDRLKYPNQREGGVLEKGPDGWPRKGHGARIECQLAFMLASRCLLLLRSITAGG